jgi:hypothetical protein
MNYALPLFTSNAAGPYAPGGHDTRLSRHTGQVAEMEIIPEKHQRLHQEHLAGAVS